MLELKQMAPMRSAAFVPMAPTTMADSKSFSQVDTNRNVALSYRELVNAFGRKGADQLWRQNGGRQMRADDVGSGRAGSDDNRDDDRDDDGDDD